MNKNLISLFEESDAIENTSVDDAIAEDTSVQALPDMDLDSHIPTFDEWSAEHEKSEEHVEKMDNEDDILGAQVQEAPQEEAQAQETAEEEVQAEEEVIQAQEEDEVIQAQDEETNLGIE